MPNFSSPVRTRVGCVTTTHAPHLGQVTQEHAIAIRHTGIPRLPSEKYNRSTLMALTPGTRLGPYEITAPLGVGGMGEVYRARDSVLKRDVAIKVLPSVFSRDPDRLRRFEHEAQAAAALNHPNILVIYQFGIFGDAPYLVSELLEGSTLRERVAHGPMSARKAIDYGVQIACGLAAAHEKGIVHRDLKPESS